MKKFRYTKTALASLLTLCSLNSFAVDREIKKLDSSLEVMKTSNKKLREKINKVCNNVPKKKEDKNFVRNIEDAASTVGSKVNKGSKDISNKTSDVVQATKDKASNVAQATKDKASNVAQAAKDKASNLVKTEKNKADDAAKVTESQKAFPVDSKKQDKNKKDNYNIKQATNKNINDKFKNENNGKADASIRKDTGLKVTFGSVVEAQGHYKLGSNNDDKKYNVMNKLSVGDYSRNGGTFADAVLHLRAEDKNEDLSMAYGADVQLHVPVSKGKSDIYGIQAIRNRGVHAFLNTEYGDFKVGYQFGPEASMRLDATRIATTDGGTDSDWFKKVNLEGKSHDFPFYVTPRLYTESLSSGSAKFAFKEMSQKNHINTLPFRVAYYSPSYMGFRFGVSYSPRYEESLFEMDQPGNMKQEKYKETLNFDNKDSKGSKAYNNVVDTLDTGIEFSESDIRTIAAGSGNTEQQINIEALTQKTGLLKTDDDLKNLSKRLSKRIQDGVDVNFAHLTNQYDFTYLEAQFLKEKLMNSFAEQAVEIAIINNIPASNSQVTAPDKIVEHLTKATNKVYKEKIIDKNKESIQQVLTTYLVRNSLTTNLLPLLVHSGPSYEHIVSGGVSYEYYFDEYKLRVKGAAVAEYGKAGKPDEKKHIYDQCTEYHDLQGFNIGAIADYKIDEDQSIKFAGSFAHLGKSGQPKKELKLNGGKYEEVAGHKAWLKAHDNNTMYWTLGAAYQYENIGASITYFGSKMNDGDKLHDLSLGAQYNLSSKGSKTEFIPYAALHCFKTEENTAHKKANSSTESKENDNVHKCTFVVVGVKFVF